MLARLAKNVRWRHSLEAGHFPFSPVLETFDLLYRGVFCSRKKKRKKNEKKAIPFRDDSPCHSSPYFLLFHRNIQPFEKCVPIAGWNPATHSQFLFFAQNDMQMGECP